MIMLRPHLIMACLLLLSLTACNEQTKTDTNPATANAQTDQATTETVSAMASIPATKAASTAAEFISVDQQRIRSVPPGQTVTGAFMILKNPTQQTVSLIAAHSDIAGVTELHETTMQEGGVMKMQKIDKIDIPAQGQAELKPGGLHIMLINLSKEPVNGDSESITLKFSDNSELEVVAPVMDIMK